LSVWSLRVQVSDCISFVVPLIISVLNMSFFNKEFKTEDFPTPDLPYAPILNSFSLSLKSCWFKEIISLLWKLFS